MMTVKTMEDYPACKWCGKLTGFPNDEECMICWAIRSQIERYPDRALRIIISLIKKDSAVSREAMR